MLLFLALAMPLAAQPPAPGAAPAPASNDAATTPVTLEDVIDFSLNNADINAVISFIGKYTNKPVMKEKSVNAQLTIKSPEKIPAYQALDLVYDALRMENIIVIETEELVQIIPAAETAKYDIVTFTGALPEDVARQKARLIRKIIPLMNVRAGAIKAQLEPLLGKHALIVADERTNKLMITDTVRNIERYEEILTELDIIGFDNMEVRVVPLKYGNAVELAKILNETVVQAAAGPQQQGPDARKEGRIIVMAEARTNSLVVASPMERMNTVVSFIQRMDVPEPKDLTVRVVPLKFAEAPSIANSIGDIFRRRPGRAEQDLVEVRATGRDNSLLILASSDNFDLVMEIVKSLDTEESRKRETRRYELKHLDADETAKELTKLYGETQSRQSPFFYYYSYGPQQQRDEVKFVPIARSNSILAVAPPTEFDLIESLIEEIDQPVDAEATLPRIYYIRYAKASDVEEVLNAVFGKQTQTTGWWDYWRTTEDDAATVGRLTGKIRFSSDNNTNSIIAIANNPANYEIVDKMIEKLDTMMPELANTMIVPLQHANAAVLVNELNSLFGRPTRPEGERREGEDTGSAFFSFWWGGDTARRDTERPISNLIEQVRFVADPRTNSILVTTSAQNFDVIRDLVRQLDQEEPQVLIKVRIVEVQRDKDKRIGLRWTPAPGTFSPEDLENSVMALSSLDFMDSIGAGNSTIGAASGTSLGRDFNQTLDAGTGVISSSINLNLLLQLLIKNLNAEIVISPTLYVSNNEKGMIFVGENIPRLKGTQITPEGTRNDTFENEDIGITMEIVPNISKNGQVVLNVSLTTAQRTGVTRFGSDVLQKREYNTKLAVNNQDTMVLGGIRMTTSQKTVRKIPLLGDIPLVGPVFRNTVDTNQLTDLYAFITPHIIATPADGMPVTEEIRDSIGKVDEEPAEKPEMVTN